MTTRKTTVMRQQPKNNRKCQRLSITKSYLLKLAKFSKKGIVCYIVFVSTVVGKHIKRPWGEPKGTPRKFPRIVSATGVQISSCDKLKTCKSLYFLYLHICVFFYILCSPPDWRICFCVIFTKTYFCV